MRHVCFSVCSIALLSASMAGAEQLPTLSDLFAEPTYKDVQISPDGKYIGVIVPVEGRKQLVTLSSDKSKLIFRFGIRDGRESIDGFQWLKDNHVLMWPKTVHGWAEQPVWYGDLIASGVDGKNFRFVYGHRVGEEQVGSNLKKATSTFGWGELLSDLPDDSENILVASYPWAAEAATPSVLKVRLRDGKSWRLMGAPRTQASFVSSPLGEVKFATATDSKMVEHVYERRDGDWQEIASNTERQSGMTPISLFSDGNTLYYLADEAGGHNALYQYRTDNRESTLVYRHDNEHIQYVETDPYTGEPLWVRHVSDGDVHILNPNHRIAKIRQQLGDAFPESKIELTSITRDYKKAIFYVYSDRDPGVWYSVDSETRKAHLELVAHSKIDPEQMVPMQHIKLQARDGLELAGYFTAKPRADKQKPPMVVLVHGGPHVRDRWEYNPEVQMLATRGYAVLQINFRGSSGYGKAFELAGRGQWGKAMQDDLTDATRWAIDQGLADPARICIMGGSYGGYAALMGLVKEPDLYRCGISLYGPTDLELMFDEGDVPDRAWGRTYLESALGTNRADWIANSPTKQVERIKAPVLILAGGKDERVPLIHSERMEAALRKAGKPVETLYFPTEGHGFFRHEHRVQAYEKVLDFLNKNIGPKTN